MSWFWYTNNKLRSHVVTYKNEKEANSEANRAAKHGWMAQAIGASDGHINVGRTMLKVVALGVPFLVTGASRTKGEVTFSYTRTPEWLAQHSK